MKVSAVVVAAGWGRRLGSAGRGMPKALIRVAGRPLIEHALVSLRAVPEVSEIVVVHPPGEERAFRAAAGEDVVLVRGGETRAGSVRAGVAAVDRATEVVAIHDAARALVPPAVVARTLEALTGDVVAAAPGLPVPDTLKRVGRDGNVVGTVGRGGLWAVHTPQVVRRDVLDVTFEYGPGRDLTDDLAYVEEAIAAGVVVGRVVLVRGDPRDLKVTEPEDLVVAEALVRGLRPPAPGALR